MHRVDGFTLSQMTKDDIDQDFAHVSAVGHDIIYNIFKLWFIDFNKQSERKST